LDAFLLTDLVSSRLVLEIDWIAGSEPHPEALEGLKQTLAVHLPEGKRIDVLGGEAIDAEEWERARDSLGTLAAMISRHLDHDPRRITEYEVIYVLYVPTSEPAFEPGLYGRAQTLPLPFGDRRGEVRTVLVFLDQIRRGAALWITRRKVERAILVHEIGHHLGLVANPQHEQPDHPGHCTRKGCVMHRPGAVSGLHNALPALFAGQIPDDYCSLCRADIAEARTSWERQAVQDPGLVDRLLRERSAPASTGEVSDRNR